MTMKKLFLLAVCAMAVTTAWAQEEEEKVTTMVITRTNGTTVDIPITDVKDITFEEKAALVLPTTAGEAKVMLAGQWKCGDADKAALLGLIGMSANAAVADEACIDIQNDRAVVFIKVNEQFVEALKQVMEGSEEWEMYGKYYEAMVGTYVAMEDTDVLGAQNAIPNETDPTQGTLGDISYSNLSNKTLTLLGINLTRVEETIVYTFLAM